MPTYVTLRAHSRSRSASVRVPSVTPLAAPVGLALAVSGTLGAFTGATATYYYKITAIGYAGETLASSEQSIAVDTAVDDQVSVTWTTLVGAVSYRIYRGTASNTQTAYFTSTTNSFIDTGAVGTAGTTPARNTATANAGGVVLKWNVDTLVNLDDFKVRRALGEHRAIGQYVVSSANLRTAAGVTLTVNS